MFHMIIKIFWKFSRDSIRKYFSVASEALTHLIKVLKVKMKAIHERSLAIIVAEKI